MIIGICMGILGFVTLILLMDDKDFSKQECGVYLLIAILIFAIFGN